MKRTYIGKLLLLVATALSFFCCQKEEDAPMVMEEHEIPLILKGGVESYDDDTKSGESLAFKNGDILYVRLQNGPGLVVGTACFNADTDTWAFTYNGSIIGWEQVSAKCYYIPEYVNSSKTDLTLDYRFPIYADESASLTVGPNSVTLTAHLTPKTGRLSLGKGLSAGVTRNVKFLSGLSYYTGFSLKDFTLIYADNPEISFGATKDNYFHGFFSSQDEPSISLQYGRTVYSRSFGSGTAVLQAGHSGYLTVPSYSNHQGWEVVNSIDPEKEEFSVKGVTFNMVTVPDGSFSMGMENVAYPVHEVTLDEFQIGETEVTQELWEAVMGSNPSSFDKSYMGQDNLPVETVSYWDVQVFLFKLNQLMKDAGKKVRFRLPTEAEWEYAAREGEGSPLLYSGSDVIADVGWYGENSGNMTHPVKQKGANALGLYDMSGNVWEMVNDWYNGEYPSESQVNPRGSSVSGNGPVRRGGSYSNDNSDPWRVSARTYWSNYSEGSANIGFRLACGGPTYEPEMVDMGLPSGLKWSSINLGAFRPTDMGYYYAWGETIPKSSYTWSNYKFMREGGSTEWDVQGYTFEDGYSSDGTWYSDGVFVGDNRKVLEMEDDAARILWGGDWRMPTPTDWKELQENCSFSWIYACEETNGVGCLIATSNQNGNQLIFPAIGFFNSDGLMNLNSWEYFYQSNAVGYSSRYANVADMWNAGLGMVSSRARYEGYNIRPVCGNGNNYSIDVSLEGDAIYFGVAAVNKTVSRTFTIRNTGSLPITINATLSGSSFSVSPSGNSNIPVGGTQEFTVSFAPTSNNYYDGMLTLSSDKLSEERVFYISGTGVVVESSEFTVNGVSFNMISLPGGTFNMGRSDIQTPVHEVWLDSFQIGETEVTQELWEAVMDNNPSNHQGSQLPVENVNWYEVQAFIGRLNALTGQHFHLPTEAEWEYAARECGQDIYRFSGSDNLSEVGWWIDNSDDTTHPVKQKKPNSFGLYDMSGNVLEWCRDCYYEYPSEAKTNLMGDAYGSPITRGGNYGAPEYSHQVYWRRSDGISVRAGFIGFRLALGGGSIHEPEMVDLGLPSGLKWASFNIGASRPAELGYYFAWGETTPKYSYEWSNYQLATPGSNNHEGIIKYTHDDLPGDGKKTLDVEDDAATVLWGNDWRIPSPPDWQELLDNCSFGWTSRDGINGAEITGPNGNSIFLPGWGYVDGQEHYNVYDWAWYSSSSLDSYSGVSTNFYMGWDGNRSLISMDRFRGLPIRPVSGIGNVYAMGVSTTEIDMGYVAVNEPTPIAFSVINNGYLPLTVTVTSENSAFTVSPSSFTLGAQQSTGVTVTCTPMSAGTTQGEITVSAAEKETPLTVLVTARGISIDVTTYTVPGTNVSFKMVSVPGGTFDMGMDSGRQVTLDDFSIGQTEVTQELWQAVMGENPSYHQGQANLPVENIAWFDAKVFVEKLSVLTGIRFRLPTEAEWEYAARGGSPASYDTYSGGSDLYDIAWYYGNSDNTTHPVATKRSNSLGLYDMSGNVWEWCEGFYGNLPTGYLNNPRGFAYSSSANHRGGAYNSEGDCSVTKRGDSLGATGCYEYLGFRLASGGPDLTPQAIDMGTGVKWASCNLGAGSEAELGYYYAWGEELPKKGFTVESYKHGDGVNIENHQKYNASDMLITLEDQDDAAKISLGNGWRIPSSSEWVQLLENCTRSQEIINGMYGIRLTSTINGNSIFLPATGFVMGSWGEWGYYINDGAYYWANDVASWENYANAYSVYLWYNDNTVSALSSSRRQHGLNIRPVHD